MNNQKNMDEELNLRDFLSILIKGKIIIIIITFFVTVSSVVYSIKATPIYNGNVLVEIGEVDNNLGISNNQLTTVFNIDNVYTLREIVGRGTGVKAEILGGVTNMLQLSYEGPNKNEIKSKLENAVDFILDRHQEKVKFYQTEHTKIRMTRIIGEIVVNDQPIRPKKRMIVAVGFVAGLMLGIFIVFLRELYIDRRKHSQVEHV